MKLSHLTTAKCLLVLLTLSSSSVIGSDHAVDRGSTEAATSSPVFGDYNKVKVDATGFIHVKEVDGKWWFIDPNGYGFWPMGVAHIRPFDAVMHKFPGHEAYGKETIKRLTDLGLDATASINNEAMKKAAKSDTPVSYGMNTWPFLLEHSSKYKNDDYFRPDPFTDEYETFVDDTLKQTCANHKNDPNILGYHFGWNTFEHMHKWINHLLAHEGAGKVAIVKLYKEIYESQIADFNAVYDTNFGDFDELRGYASIEYDKSLDIKPNEEVTTDKKRDFNKIVNLILKRVHKLNFTYTRKYDPNHLVMGAFFKPYNFNLEMYETIGPYVDVLSPQMLDLFIWDYDARLPVQKIYELTGKPIHISDQWTGTMNPKVRRLPKIPYAIADTEADRGAVLYRYAQKALAHPEVLGITFCTLFWDQPDPNGAYFGDGGMFDREQKETTEYTKYIRAISRQKYALREQTYTQDDINELGEQLKKTMRDAVDRVLTPPDVVLPSDETAQAVIASEVVGNEQYVHLEKSGDTWWLVDGNGHRFVPTGMNHIGEMHRFAPYNRTFWLKEFGAGIYKDGRIDWKSPEVKKWMARIAKDHKDFGFNSISFHRPQFMPDEYWEDLEIFYFGKPKLGEITATYAAKYWGGMPDVFSEQWQTKAEAIVKAHCQKHKNNKYYLGHTFNDQPDYAINAIRKNQKDFFHHPWVIDIIKQPGLTPGKHVWMEILQTHYLTPQEAGEMYGVDMETWEDVGAVTDWPKPKDQKQGEADQTEMLKKCVEAWLKTHHDLLKKHDPNHLIYGDKIGMGVMGPGWGGGQPDWIWDIVKKYVDVVLIQSYDFYNQRHRDQLAMVHERTGLPIINGDHSYGFKRPKMNAVKGVPVSSLEAVGVEYSKYLKGIMSRPYMLGWQTCGYMETWSGITDPTGQEQGGFFDPYGEPLMEALSHAKAANEQAVQWHQSDGDVSSDSMPEQSQQPKRKKPQETGPSTVAELFAALKFTQEQQAAFKILEKERKVAFARFNRIEGTELSDARTAFFTDREAKLHDLFTEEQLSLWTVFWARSRNAKE